MPQASKKPFITMFQVIKEGEKTLFDYEGKTFQEISGIPFEGIGNTGPSSVPILVFRGPRLEFADERWFFHEYGTHGASIGVFQYDFSKFKGWKLKAEWFHPGDTLAIVGHSREFTKETLEWILKD